MKILQTQVTSPRIDIVLMIFAAIVCVDIGGMIEASGRHPAVGWTFWFVGVLNLFNAWQTWRRLPKKSGQNNSDPTH